MKAQNVKERTRATLQFIGLFVLATLLASSTFYLPGSVKKKSYEQLEQDLNGYKVQIEAEKKFVEQFSSRELAIGNALAKTDSLIRELEKINSSASTVSVDLLEAIDENLEKAKLGSAEAERLIESSKNLKYRYLIAAYEGAISDKKKLVEYIEKGKEKAEPVDQSGLVAKMDRQETQIEKLREEKNDLKQKYDHCVASMSNDCRMLNDKINQYENQFEKIIAHTNTIEKAATEVKGDAREVVIGKDYRIRNPEKFNQELSQITSQLKTIRDLAMPKR